MLQRFSQPYSSALSSILPAAFSLPRAFSAQEFAASFAAEAPAWPQGVVAAAPVLLPGVAPALPQDVAAVQAPA